MAVPCRLVERDEASQPQMRKRMAADKPKGFG